MDPTPTPAPTMTFTPVPSPTPSPLHGALPIPLPVEFDPSVPDWIAAISAAVGVLATVIIGLLALNATVRANRAQAAADQAQIAAIQGQARATNEQISALRLVADALDRNDAALARFERPYATSPSADDADPPTGDIDVQPGVRWVVERGAGPRFNLTNRGTGTATNVRVEPENTNANELSFPFGIDGFEVTPGSYFPVSWEKSFASPAAMLVVVSWDEGETPFTTRLVIG